MPDKTTKRETPKESEEGEKSKQTLHIRKISPDLIERVNGVSGYIGMDRDDLVTTILEKSLGRFKTAQKDAKDWFESFVKPKD